MLFILTPNGTIDANGVQELFYLTSINNLASILDNGILCHKRANRLDPNHVDIADDGVQERRANKIVERVDPNKQPLSLHRYAPLFLNPHNHMAYRCYKENPALCILRIYPEVLSRGDAVITNRNASTNAAEFFTASAFELNKVESTMISNSDPIWYSRLKRPTEEDKDTYKQLRQAEVLLPYEIAPRYIGGVFVATPAIGLQVQPIIDANGNNIHLSVVPSIFREGNGDFIHLARFPSLKAVRPLPADFAQVDPDTSDSEDEGNIIALRRNR